MPSDTVLCAAEVAPGKACGRSFNRHRLARGGADSHPFIPGRQCRECDGSGTIPGWQHVAYTFERPCPRCIGGVETIKEAVDE